MNLPQKSVERLSQYRRILYSNLEKGKEYIYSHELASQLHLTPVQVRRDIMLIGYSGTQRKGYVIEDLIQRIGEILDGEKKINTAVIGMGNLGKAITSYFNGKRTKLDIAAAFDVDEQKINRVISNVRCYHINQISEKIKDLDISIAIMTLSPEHAQEVADLLVVNDIKGILNFTSVPLSIPDHIYVEDYDMVTSMEKVAYFVNHND
ncbi:MAG TPA: redox-sensing transcriptional repressor Rex [Bacteroidales bacterium]|nr:redox-sensing transcriptional repressor Rex [Bacteroidales bacterium]